MLYWRRILWRLINILFFKLIPTLKCQFISLKKKKHNQISLTLKSSVVTFLLVYVLSDFIHVIWLLCLWHSNICLQSALWWTRYAASTLMAERCFSLLYKSFLTSLPIDQRVVNIGWKNWRNNKFAGLYLCQVAYCGHVKYVNVLLCIRQGVPRLRKML